MNFKKMSIPEIQVIEEYVDYTTIKGYRSNTFSWTQLRQHGIEQPFIYESELRVTHKNTLKGLYYQSAENQESILVRCICGGAVMKIVDIRPESRTYRHTVTVELSEKKCQYVYIPYGFAHGILTMEDNTYLQYKSDNYYFGEKTKIINCFDPLLKLKWPTADEDIIMAIKERYAKGANDIDKEFFMNRFEEGLDERNENE